MFYRVNVRLLSPSGVAFNFTPTVAIVIRHLGALCGTDLI